MSDAAATVVPWRPIGPVTQWRRGDPDLYESIDGGPWRRRRRRTDDEYRLLLEIAYQLWLEDGGEDVPDLLARLERVSRHDPPREAT